MAVFLGQSGIAMLSALSYDLCMRMQGITIKLPDAILRRLRQQARETGRSVNALVRDRLEAGPDRQNRSVFGVTSDLAGSLAGGRRPAVNARRKFRRL